MATKKKKKYTLGPFSMHKRIGKGAMGEVWEGSHPGQELSIAVKVLNRKRIWEDRHLEGFRQEVKAVAQLNHPGIIMVLDYGEVSKEEARRSRWEFLPGTPYLAMELATYGALDRLEGKLSWPTLFAVLRSLLDALATPMRAASFIGILNHRM